MYELQLRVCLASVLVHWKAFESGVQKMFSVCRNTHAVSGGLAVLYHVVCVDAGPLRQQLTAVMYLLLVDHFR